MEITYENISTWFDEYFKIVGKTGSVESVPKIGKFFTDDFEYIYYTLPQGADFTSERAGREGLLMMFLHPGLNEVFKPEFYAIDMKKMIVSVKFYDQLISETDGVLGSFYASAIYHMIPAEDTGLKIRKIEYWTSNQTSESMRNQAQAWARAREGAFGSIISGWLKANY
jgi:hypothetical protein